MQGRARVRDSAKSGTLRRGRESRTEMAMPSLLRFLAVIGIIVGVCAAIVYSLAYLVDPKPREISVTVPPDHFYKQR
jgi:hypothetical protein